MAIAKEITIPVKFSWGTRVRLSLTKKWGLEKQAETDREKKKVVDLKLKLARMEIVDLNDRLEAYKDLVAAITFENRLRGMAAQRDLDIMGIRRMEEE